MLQIRDMQKTGVQIRQLPHERTAMTNPVSPACERALKRLGENMSRARRRRHWSQRDMAEQMGASVSTVRRMESGDPGISMQHLFSALAAFCELEQLYSLLDTRRDEVGVLLQDRALPERIRARTSTRR